MTTHAVTEAPIVIDEEPPFVVLVPVGSAAAVRRTAPVATLIARAHHGVVTFIAVRRLRYDIADRPDRVPEWLTEAIAEVKEHAGAPEIEISAIARLGQSVVGAIETAARDLKAQILLLHWESGELTIPRVERDAFTQLFVQPPCTALMLRGRYQPGEEPTILLVSDSQPAAQVASELATALLSVGAGGNLRMLSVVHAEATDVEVAAAAQTTAERLPELPRGIHGDAVVHRARSHEAATLQALGDEETSLAVVAAPREGVVRRLGRARLPERLLRPSATPVLIVNRPEARPLTLFHRLWGTIYDRLPNLTEEEKVAAYMQLRRSARADSDYHVLMMLAAAVATLGVLLDSPAVVIGAMLLAPLMSPIAGAALGVVQGDSKMIRLSLGSVASGTAAALLIATLAALLLPGSEATTEFTSRTEPGLLDLLVALGSGMAAAYAISRPGMSAALPGVAVAAALVPPLAAISVGVVLGEWREAAGAALLFGTNLVAIAAASAVTFLWLGFRPDADRLDRFGVFGRGVVGLFVLLVAVAIPLTALSARALEADERAARAEDTLVRLATQIGGLEFADVRVSDTDGEDGLIVRTRLLAEEPLSAEQAEAIRNVLERDLDEAVSLEVEVTQLIRNGP